MLRLFAVLGCLILTGCSTSAPVATSSSPPPKTAAKAKVAVTDSSRPRDTGTVTLDQALTWAQQYHPALSNAHWATRIAAAQENQAGLWPNPEFEFEMEDIGGTGERRGFDGTESTYTLSQPIDLGGKRQQRRAVAQANTRLSQWDLKLARLAIERQTRLAFNEVWMAQQQVELAQQLADLSEQLADMMTRKVKAGSESPLQQTQAEMQATRSDIERQQAEARLNQARLRLVGCWGSVQARFERVLTPANPLPGLPDLAQSMEQLEASPHLARWQDQLEQGRAALALTKAESIQDITLTGGLKRAEEINENTAILGLGLQLPLFNRNQARRETALHQLAQLKAQEQQARLEVQLQLQQLHITLSATLTEAQQWRDILAPQAEANYRAAVQGYEQGKFDALHVLNAQRSLFEAQQEALVKTHQATQQTIQYQYWLGE